MSRSGIYDLVYGFIPDDDIPQEPPKPTNADKIRAMSDKELAEFLMKPTRIVPKYECEDCENDCTECVFEWLKKEVDDG